GAPEEEVAVFARFVGMNDLAERPNRRWSGDDAAWMWRQRLSECSTLQGNGNRRRAAGAEVAVAAISYGLAGAGGVLAIGEEDGVAETVEIFAGIENAIGAAVGVSEVGEVLEAVFTRLVVGRRNRRPRSGRLGRDVVAAAV